MTNLPNKINQNHKTENIHNTNIASNDLNTNKQKKPSKLKKHFNIRIILSSFVLLLMVAGGSAGFYLNQFTQLDLRQQAYVGETCQSNTECNNDRKDEGTQEYCVANSSGIKKCTTVKPQAKDCSFAKHNDYACASLVECVQCVDGQSSPATRANCAAQNPNSPCKPSTNDSNCGWANHEEYACKTLDECVQCVNGAMIDSTSPSCPSQCRSQDTSCSEQGTKECIKNGKQGLQSCTFTEKSSQSPFECNSKPTNCGSCMVNEEEPDPPPATCGKEDQSCCTTGSSCESGLACTNNTCSIQTSTPKFSCLDGSCKEDIDGDYILFGICNANCETETEAGASCSRRGTDSCMVNGQVGTQTCTFTTRGSISPFNCNQDPVNCTSCETTNPTQCTYSANQSQNEKQCFLSNMRVCNSTNMWSIGSCTFDCQNNNCCGGDGETCCAGAGADQCKSYLVCGTEGTCRELEPILDTTETTTSSSNMGGASCDGTSYLKECGENMVMACQYTKRANQNPYACDQGEICGQCVPIISSTTNVVDTSQTSECDHLIEKPFCLNNNTIATCLPGSGIQPGTWYEVDCPTRCSNRVCAAPSEYEQQQQLYDYVVNSIQNNSVNTIVNDDSLGILHLTSSFNNK